MLANDNSMEMPGHSDVAKNVSSTLQKRAGKTFKKRVSLQTRFKNVSGALAALRETFWKRF
jgi:hypothetical protein